MIHTWISAAARLRTLATVLTISTLCASAAAFAGVSPLHVKGNQILDNHNHPVLLRGVCVPGLEWSVTGDHNVQSVTVATTEWHANIVRIPLAEDNWFGKMPGQTDDGAAYRALVKQVVTTAESHNAYVILDLHWSDRNIWGVDVDQHKMPDDHSILFWKSLAADYANDPGVLFDLYNEPHDVSSDIWLNGGEATDHRRDGIADATYHAVGLQTLLDTIRSTGAKNVCIAGSLDWAYSTKDILAGDALRDPNGHGVIYANHAYPFKGESVIDWEHRMQDMTRKYPIIVSEFGSDPPGGQQLTGAQWVQEVLGAMEANHWSFTAWCLHPAASPCLIKDWTYQPTDHFGVFVKQALAGAKFPDPAQGTTSGSYQPR